MLPFIADFEKSDADWEFRKHLNVKAGSGILSLHSG